MPSPLATLLLLLLLLLLVLASHVASAAQPAQAGQPALPATVAKLCASAAPPPQPDGQPNASMLGSLQRLQTPTADWGFYRFGNASSSRPALILIPGFGATLDVWPLDFLAQLAADQEVVVLDNRGQGATTDLEPTAPLTIPGMANDTMDFIQALDLEQPPNVLGWSMGGMVATSLAALHGDQLGKIVAVAGSAGGSESTPPTDRAVSILTSPLSTDVQRLGLNFDLNTTDGLKNACQYAYLVRASSASANATTTQRQLSAIVNYLIYDDSIYELLPGIANPVLMAAGLQDEVVPAANSRAMAELLPHPWLVTYAGGAHAAFIQHQPAFLQVLSAFLADA